MNEQESLSTKIVKLDDFLYGDHTLPEVISLFSTSLRKNALLTKDDVDLAMSSFFLDYNRLLLDSKNITQQSVKLVNFYFQIVNAYPKYAFTFVGRLKSLYRTYLKYNRYIMNFISAYYSKNNAFPNAKQINDYISNRFRDVCGYKLIVNLPLCNVDSNLPLSERKLIKTEKENETIYKIANSLPLYLMEQNFDILLASSLSDVDISKKTNAPEMLSEEAKPYFKDYIHNPNKRGYKALHLAAHDIEGGSNLELQLTSFDDDSCNQLIANHDLYENHQKENINNDPKLSECIYYAKALDRTKAAYALDFSKLRIDMFTALDNNTVNDSSGFVKARKITPHEHLSEHQLL